MNLPPHNACTGVNGSTVPHATQTNRGRSTTTPSESNGDGDARGGGGFKVASVDGSRGLDANGLGQRIECTPHMYPPPPLDASGLGQRFKCTDLSLSHSAGIYILNSSVSSDFF